MAHFVITRLAGTIKVLILHTFFSPGEGNESLSCSLLYWSLELNLLLFGSRLGVSSM